MDATSAVPTTTDASSATSTIVTSLQLGAANVEMGRVWLAMGIVVAVAVVCAAWYLYRKRREAGNNAAGATAAAGSSSMNATVQPACKRKSMEVVLVVQPGEDTETHIAKRSVPTQELAKVRQSGSLIIHERMTPEHTMHSSDRFLAAAMTQSTSSTPADAAAAVTAVSRARRSTSRAAFMLQAPGSASTRMAQPSSQPLQEQSASQAPAGAAPGTASP